jgi:CHAT domain-containing protein/Flp pilus assembly protein TadD
LALATTLCCTAFPALAASPVEEATALSIQAGTLYRQGRAAEAIALAEQVLVIREKKLGPDHPDTAKSVNNLAVFYDTIGDYAKAELLYLRALAIQERILGLEHPDTLISLNNLAVLYNTTGTYAKAEQLLLRALAIQERILGPEHPDTATSLNNLASGYYFSGAYTKAEPLLLRALAIAEKALGSDHTDTAQSLCNLAELYRVTGAYAKAESLFLRALAIALKVQGAEHPDTATSMNNLAGLYYSTGAYARAEALFQRALTIREEILGTDHPDTAKSVNNLAVLYEASGDSAKAETLYLRAVAIWEKALGPEHPDIAIGLDNLAILYEATGAYAKAEPLHLRALTIREKALGQDHPDTALSLNNLALYYYTTGAYDKAEPLFRLTKSVSEKVLGPNYQNTAVILGNSANFYWAQGDFAQSLPISVRVREIYEINITRLVQIGTEERRRQYLATLDHSADVSYSLVDPAPEARALGATAVLQLKGRVLDATADAQARLRQRLDAPGQALLTELQQVVAQRGQLTLTGPGKRNPSAWKQQLDVFAQNQEHLEMELANRSREFQQALQPVTLQRVQAALRVRDVLIEWTRYQPFNPKGQKVEQRWGAPRYAAYLIASDQPPEVVDLGPADAIEAATQRMQQALQRPSGDPRPTEARELHRLVMQPLLAPLARLQAQPGQVLLSPDGALNLVPLAALVDSENRYLGERYALSYLSSGRDLLKLQDIAAPRSGITVMANPDYDQADQSGQTGPTPANTTAAAKADANQRAADLDRSGMTFKPLPGTAGEAKLLQQLFALPAGQVATGPTATEARLKRVSGPSILHIATHGFFLTDPPQADSAGAAASQRGLLVSRLRDVESDDGSFAANRRQGLGENPLLRSGLALAGANQRQSEGGEDGILTAAEAAQLDLEGTQLVVLSACQTGTGDVVNGEGVYGLRRALVLAGAQSQLVSLWNVNDAATERLMGEYYRRLQKGEGRAQALRSAQDVIRANPATAHPYYWAAFIPVGDWRPLNLGTTQTEARAEGTR